jgi:glycosyltransferase involved in cell wall biosynthesis
MSVTVFNELDIACNHSDLSIVMPIYNSVNSIQRSVKSFLSLAEKLLNDYDINCSLYIIDDFSTDGSSQAADDLFQSHDNIFLIKNDKNLGPGLARNKALDIIKTGYVGFLDADDEIIANDYADSYVKGINLDADWITFNGWFCHSDIKNSKYDFDRLTDDTEQLSIKCRRGELDGSVIFSIYSLQLIRDNNLNFPGGYYEDIPFAYKAMLIAKKRYISNNYSYKKYNINTSIVNTISRKHIRGLFNAWLRVDIVLEDFKSSNTQTDRLYGIYGYIANLIKSIILSEHSSQYKKELFNFLYIKVEAHQDLLNCEYNISTQKELLVEYFKKNFPKKKTSFLSDIKDFNSKL